MVFLQRMEPVEVAVCMRDGLNLELAAVCKKVVIKLAILLLSMCWRPKPPCWTSLYRVTLLGFRSKSW